MFLSRSQVENSTPKSLCIGRWLVKGPFVIGGSVIFAMAIIIIMSQTEAPLSHHLLFPQVLVNPLPRPKPTFLNITGKIMVEMAGNGTGPCYEQRTNYTQVIGLFNSTLYTNIVHKFWLQSFTSVGKRRCTSGDYYELDLSSSLWKSRPRSEDLQNGTYAVEFMVPDRYAGDYNFSASLLFDAYHGLDFHPEAWSIVHLAVFLNLKFVTRPPNSTHSTQQPDTAVIEQCGTSKTNFEHQAWSGRWSRPVENATCQANAEGRYEHCFSAGVPCRIPSWCSGEAAALESVGWSYSAHCAFHIFTAQEAWDCLDGRWLFFWGDSNHQDTIRNLLFFILHITPPPGRDLQHFAIDRSYQNWFRNPANLSQEFRITSHYNGHPMVDTNGKGFASLENPHYRNYVAAFFAGKTSYPDTVIMNSGLHDGLHHPDLRSFLSSVDMAMEYWKGVLGNVSGHMVPEVVYRTTVAPAGSARGMQSNPQKMEVYNRIVVEQVQRAFPDVKLVDAFDMSFPFHFDNGYSDGGHYGHPPHPQHPHFYFVDVMLAHVLLNAICPLELSQ